MFLLQQIQHHDDNNFLSTSKQQQDIKLVLALILGINIIVCTTAPFIALLKMSRNISTILMALVAKQ